MKRRIIYIFLVLVVLLQQFGHAAIYCKIKGRVIDEETKEGIPDVYVNAHLFRHDSPKEYYVFTDGKGYFTFSNLIPGRYELNYDPLYPYVPYPEQKHLRTRWENSFVIKEGEIKSIVKELRKGGEIILNIKLGKDILSEYIEKKYYLDRIEGGELKTNIRIIYHKYFNPRFKPAPNGKRESGLAPGEYILCKFFKKKSKYYSGNDVEYAGIIKTFSLGKMEKKTIDLDYNSNSKIIFNIKDKNGNKFYYGRIEIYKELVINSDTVYYSVWEYLYDRGEAINPIIIDPGRYFIFLNNGGELISHDGRLIEYHTNEFSVKIIEGETKQLNLVVSIDEKLLPEIDENTKFIH